MAKGNNFSARYAIDGALTGAFAIAVNLIANHALALPSDIQTGISTFIPSLALALIARHFTISKMMKTSKWFSNRNTLLASGAAGAISMGIVPQIINMI